MNSNLKLIIIQFQKLIYLITVSRWEVPNSMSLSRVFCPPPPQSGAGDMEIPGVCLLVRPSVRPRYVDQLISNLHTSIILGISSLNSKLGKIRKKIVRMAAIFKVSANPHQNFKVLQFQRRLIFRRFLTWGMCSHYGSYFQYDRQNT